MLSTPASRFSPNSRKIARKTKDFRPRHGSNASTAEIAGKWKREVRKRSFSCRGVRPRSLNVAGNVAESAAYPIAKAVTGWMPSGIWNTSRAVSGRIPIIWWRLSPRAVASNDRFPAASPKSWTAAAFGLLLREKSRLVQASASTGAALAHSWLASTRQESRRSNSSASCFVATM